MGQNGYGGGGCLGGAGRSGAERGGSLTASEREGERERRMKEKDMYLLRVAIS